MRSKIKHLQLLQLNSGGSSGGGNDMQDTLWQTVSFMASMGLQKLTVAMMCDSPVKWVQ